MQRVHSNLRQRGYEKRLGLYGPWLNMMMFYNNIKLLNVCDKKMDLAREVF